jgi:serine phosphatase RsbU (regulator of sigma subunit)
MNVRVFRVRGSPKNMLKKWLNTWLNNGIYPGNNDALNRKIRLSNLIAGTTIIVLALYIPLFIYYRDPLDLTGNFIFLAGAIVNFPLLRHRKYKIAFTSLTILGFLYMISGGILYGLNAHMHYFLIVMCMISALMFDKKATIKFFLAFGIISFFAVEYFMYDKAPLLGDAPEIRNILKVTSYTNLFVLFVIICIFILFFKNDNLRYQREVEEQSRVIAEKNKEMTDSINYAQRLQNGLLPSLGDLSALFPRSFLYYHPKDIVSGDFYWFYREGNKVYLACGDCTGHGVPGALMSVLGINLLSEIIESKKATEPAAVLEQLRSAIVKALNKGNKGEYKDGMDISLVRLDLDQRTCTYAGANNSLYHFSEGGLTEYKADKQPVGYSSDQKPFTQKEFDLAKGDYLVFFTDGYADQFGGRANKKFMYKPFKELLASLLQEKNADVAERLEKTFRNWRGNLEQVDDVCVMGIQV